MEIGSFIELQTPTGLEYYSGKKNIARLNSGRAAIYHALTILKCNTIWLPFYQCEAVRTYLKTKSIGIKYYNINDSFEPVGLNKVMNSEAVLLVNYFGIMSLECMKKRGLGIKNVIFDNSQAFFSPPIENAMNIYSARKFFGVPDGAYVIGDNAHNGVENYPQGYSSDTSLFLLLRVEYGCEGKAYKAKIENEKRIDLEDICLMSKLTHKMLDGTDYMHILQKRKDNFKIANSLFVDINNIDPLQYIDDKCVPMVYPLVVEKENLLKKFLNAKHFQGHWWSHVYEELPKDTFEYWISKYLIPITIDQRYGKEEIQFIRNIV